MPLYQKINFDASTHIYVWKITEDYDALRQKIKLTASSELRLQKMLSESHRCGFLSIRHLLAHAGYTDADLFYDSNGKPHLSDGKHISISHSYLFATLIISTNNVGIDIEKNRDKIIRIAPKFVGTEMDYVDTKSDYIEQLSVIWGAKEALYKMCNSRSLSFLKDMHIAPFTLQSEFLCATVNAQSLDFKQNFKLYFKAIENYTLVYAVEDHE